MATATTRHTAEGLVEAADELSQAVGRLRFESPVACVYNPLEYAGEAHRQYLRTHGRPSKRVIFLGMNPGPWGMAQTGVPFGEVGLVRDWVGVHAPVSRPACEHPKRPVMGFDCHRSEVSGKRLWGLFARRFGTAENFFRDHFVANYCPLVFMEESGRNRTPDKLRAEETAALYEVCDRHLRRVIAVLEPDWVIGIGAFAEGRATAALADLDGDLSLARIPHPSPANPSANRNWSERTEQRMRELGIWD